MIENDREMKGCCCGFFLTMVFSAFCIAGYMIFLINLEV